MEQPCWDNYPEAPLDLQRTAQLALCLAASFMPAGGKGTSRLRAMSFTWAVRICDITKGWLWKVCAVVRALRKSWTRENKKWRTGFITRLERHVSVRKKDTNTNSEHKHCLPIHWDIGFPSFDFIWGDFPDYIEPTNWAWNLAITSEIPDFICFPCRQNEWITPWTFIKPDWHLESEWKLTTDRLSSVVLWFKPWTGVVYP